MTTLREAAQQALAFTMRDFASLRDFEAARAVLHDNLRAALAQQAEPVEPVAQVHPNHLKPTDDGKPWCREVLLYSGDHNGDLFKGENYRVKLYTAPPQQAEPVEPVAHLVALELERLAQDPPISGNTLAQARILMTAANVRELGLGGGTHPPAAQAQQAEPVGPYCYVYEYDGAFGLHREFYPKVYNGHKPDRTVPVYTAPPQRKPLTDQEIDRIRADCVLTPHEYRDRAYGWALHFARAVERAHGIGRQSDPQIEDRLARHGIPKP